MKERRQQYYELLQSVRETGNGEAWLSFFLQGVYEAATQAVVTIDDLMQLFNKDKALLENLGRSSIT